MSITAAGEMKFVAEAGKKYFAGASVTGFWPWARDEWIWIEEEAGAVVGGRRSPGYHWRWCINQGEGGM